jgi:hypothetical protein
MECLHSIGTELFQMKSSLVMVDYPLAGYHIRYIIYFCIHKMPPALVKFPGNKMVNLPVRFQGRAGVTAQALVLFKYLSPEFF